MKRGWNMKRVSAVTVKKRMVTVFLFGLIIFLVIIMRLGYVQFALGEELMEKANDLWTRDIVFEPERGLILDANNEVLAENVTAPSIIVTPRQITNPEKTAEMLAEILDVSVEKVFESITKNTSSVMIRPEGIKISEEQELAIRTANLEGVYLAKDSKRHRSEEHTSELQSRGHLVCRLLLEKKKESKKRNII